MCRGAGPGSSGGAPDLDLGQMGRWTMVQWGAGPGSSSKSGRASDLGRWTLVLGPVSPVAVHLGQVSLVRPGSSNVS